MANDLKIDLYKFVYPKSPLDFVALLEEALTELQRVNAIIKFSQEKPE